MKKDRLIKRLFLYLLCVLSIFIFSSCTTAGSETVLPKEELSANALADTREKSFVFEYFDEWDFPQFDTRKIKRVETVYRKNYYKDLPDTREHARLAAEYFIENYYDGISLCDSEAVAEALISSYVKTVGDRYSYYRSADEYESYSENMSGSFVGIGITVTKDDETPALSVVEVNGEPAIKAGLLAEDKIIAVDGASVADIGYTEAIARVKGEAGTDVTLTVLRGDVELTLVATRAKVTESSVTYKIEDGIGYVKITSFKSNTDEQFDEIISALERAEVKGVIYDLRSNAGGYLTAVQNMLDRIAKKGTKLVSFTNGYAEDYIANTEDSFLIPSVVICNGGTASAGELFTAGVRDIGAMGYMPTAIVGERTHGKGIMQRTYTLSDGSAVTLTVAYYNPPSGVNYDGVGIEPDQEVFLGENGDAQLDAAKAKIAEIVNNY